MLEIGILSPQLRQGRKERNETNLHDKSTNLEPTTPLVKTVSYAKKERKQKKETNLNESTSPGPSRQDHQLYEKVRRKRKRRTQTAVYQSKHLSAPTTSS